MFAQKPSSSTTQIIISLLVILVRVCKFGTFQQCHDLVKDGMSVSSMPRLL
jgi:hypothetical protein